MKIERLFTYCLFVGTYLLVSCANELATDTGTLLPEGVYPLSLTATQSKPMASPQTRVSDYEENGNYKSKWTAGDQIKVTVSGGGNTAETTCTLDGSGNITNYNPPLYWKTNQSSKINAWYSNIVGQNTTSNTVTLADQSSGLAYVLKADEVTNASYQSGNISLNFKHQLAKVRVKLEKDTYEGDLTQATVKVKGYTTCTVANGEVTGTAEGYISSLKNGDYYEANLVPQSVSATNFIKIIGKNDKEFAVKLTADALSALTGGQVYTFTVTVNKQGPLNVKLSEITTDTYTFDRDGTLEGDGNKYGKAIFIEDGVTLTIKNVKLKPTAENNYAIYGNGTATLILDGENSLTGNGDYYAGVAAKTKIIIKGNGNLTATGSGQAPGIGAGIYAAQSCGDILIEGGTIISTGGWGGSPAAGIGSNCGNITITGGNITATGNAYAAGIGSGYGQRTGSITITGGTIVAKKGQGATNSIGAGNSGSCGTISIDRDKANVTEQ